MLTHKTVLLPVLAGLLFFLVRYVLVRWSGGRHPVGVENAPRTSGIPVTESVLFLMMQVALIVFFDIGSVGGLAILVLVLSATGTAVAGYLGGWKSGYRAAAFYFGLYVAYWVCVKYVFSPVALPLLKSAVPRVEEAHLVLKSFAIAGVSYIGFKLIHFVVDLRNEEIEECDPVEVVTWLLFFPSILAGPMMRYQDWLRQRRECKLDLEVVSFGARRVILGLLMKLGVADAIYDGTVAHMNGDILGHASVGQIAVACCLYTVYLFFDFAGYSHMAIGMGSFWGVRLPENFNKPYIARNLADFWNRWHMTLSLILRDYLFYPLSLAFRRSQTFRSRTLLTTLLPPLITFLIAGVWHGAGWNFLVFGALHGVGLGVVALLKQNRYKSEFRTWWDTSRVGYAAGVGLTFCYVSFTFLFFALPWTAISVLGARLIHG